MPLYNVHLIAPVIVKFLNVEAESQKAAIEAVERGADLDSVLRQGNLRHKGYIHVIDHVEWDDSVIGAIVDEQGDDDFERSIIYALDDDSDLVPDKDIKSIVESRKEMRNLLDVAEAATYALEEFKKLMDDGPTTGTRLAFDDLEAALSELKGEAPANSPSQDQMMAG